MGFQHRVQANIQPLRNLGANPVQNEGKRPSSNILFGAHDSLLKAVTVFDNSVSPGFPFRRMLTKPLNNERFETFFSISSVPVCERIVRKSDFDKWISLKRDVAGVAQSR